MKRYSWNSLSWVILAFALLFCSLLVVHLEYRAAMTKEHNARVAAWKLAQNCFEPNAPEEQINNLLEVFAKQEN